MQKHNKKKSQIVLTDLALVDYEAVKATTSKVKSSSENFYLKNNVENVNHFNDFSQD